MMAGMMIGVGCATTLSTKRIETSSEIVFFCYHRIAIWRAFSLACRFSHSLTSPATTRPWRALSVDPKDAPLQLAPLQSAILPSPDIPAALPPSALNRSMHRCDQGVRCLFVSWQFARPDHAFRPRPCRRSMPLRRHAPVETPRHHRRVPCCWRHTHHRAGTHSYTYAVSMSMELWASRAELRRRACSREEPQTL